ncbi:MAG TPA: class I SAM-dependent methyltransferase [Bacteroidetes bacterium]|nr:glycine/sarcosine N-methyltransferase [bacterium BMS3Bbin04]HDO65722.1 class I SAM-dependent methyltransferase [Bacteroidota bacterium]HEX04847.1 class I SAM-dependent methyltransferase [Bacteroidota bacterium]
MSFYDDLGEKYDNMIRWKARLVRETPFLQRLFSEHRIKRVLDLACGTGHHALMFRKWGCEVVGYDASKALLDVARENAQEDDNGIQFVEGLFSELGDKVEGPFDAVLSLGNSIPHLAGVEELRELFADVHSILRPGGVFVFQNRNYDRLLKTRERFLLPTTHRSHGSEQLYFRFNDFEGDKVRFNIVHFRQVNEGWVHDVYSTELSPFLHYQLNMELKAANFAPNDFYGDFSGTPFDAETSPDIVGLARRSQS